MCSVEVARRDKRAGHSPGWMCAVLCGCAGLPVLGKLVSMGPDDKDIINISAPHLWFPGGGLQSPCLKVFHEDIGHDRREWEPIAAPSTCS